MNSICDKAVAAEQECLRDEDETYIPDTQMRREIRGHMNRSLKDTICVVWSDGCAANIPLAFCRIAFIL